MEKYFYWIRASFPRLRYDQLMSAIWTNMLPIVNIKTNKYIQTRNN
jgi:NADH:ubiquinone oxidoreductase subunit H